jgi:serine/threonine-protein kinase
MAPEQIMRTHAPNPRTDIYGMGAIAYFLLTGRPPFVSSDAMEVMIAHVRDPVVAPSSLRGDVPEDLERVVLRCLEKNPDHRYQDALELSRALFACKDASGWSPAEAARWWREREPRIAGEIELQVLEPGPPADGTVAEGDMPSLSASAVDMRPEPASVEKVGPSPSLGRVATGRERS